MVRRINFTRCFVSLAIFISSWPLTHIANAGDAIAGEEPYQFEPRNGDPVNAFRGSFEVPENRADPNARKITLHYVRFPSTNPDPGAPIVYLAGGPGGSGVGTARGRRFDLFMKLRGVADVIAFDQRGTGWSNDLPTCNTEIAIPLDQPLTDSAATAAYRSAAVDCREFWREAGGDINGYTTMESARDLDALRAHLGAEQINLWSISYGTHLAMAAVKVMDDHIDRIVMTGAEGLHQTVKLPARTTEFFERIQAAINEDPAAKDIYPDILTLMRRVQKKLEAEPARIELTGEDGAVFPFVFGKADTQLMTSFLIADPSGTAQLLSFYLALDAGEYDAVGALIHRYLRQGPIELDAMSAAMDIASGISADRLAQVEAQAADSPAGLYLNFPMPQLAGALGDDFDLGDEFRALPQSDTPTLHFTGTLDGRTYPDSHREALAGFSNVTFVDVVHAGHNLFMSSPEVGDRIAAFFNGEDVDDAAIELPLPDFKPPE